MIRCFNLAGLVLFITSALLVGSSQATDEDGPKVIVGKAAISLPQSYVDRLKLRITKAVLLPVPVSESENAVYTSVTADYIQIVRAEGRRRVEKVYVQQGGEVKQDDPVVKLSRPIGDLGILGAISQERETAAEELKKTQKRYIELEAEFRSLQKVPTTQEYLTQLPRKQTHSAMITAKSRVDGLKLQVESLDAEQKDVVQNGVEAQDYYAPRSGIAHQIPKGVILQKDDVVFAIRSKTWIEVTGVVKDEMTKSEMVGDEFVLRESKLKILLSYGQAPARVEAEGLPPFEALAMKKEPETLKEYKEYRPGHLQIRCFVKRSGTLKEGIQVRVIVPLDPPMIQIPHSAVVTLRGKTWVVVADGNEYALRPVEVVRSSTEIAHIRAKLSSEDAKSRLPPVGPRSQVVSEHALDVAAIIEKLVPPPQ